jgi:galactose mutarotase-like enzyme
VRSLQVGDDNVLLYDKGPFSFLRGIPGPFFPWGGRIVGGKFLWDGKEIDLTEYINEQHSQEMRNDNNGNALHGLQFPYEETETKVVTDKTTGQDVATTTMTYNAGQNPIFHKMFDQGDQKASAQLTLKYSLASVEDGEELTIDYSVHNDGPVRIANFTNLHPWFKTNKQPVQITAPVTHVIPYENNVKGTEAPVTEAYDFNKTKSINEDKYEQVFKVNANVAGEAVTTIKFADGTEIDVVQDPKTCPYLKIWVDKTLGVASAQPLSDPIGSFTQDNEPECDIIAPGSTRSWTFKIRVRRPKGEKNAVEE